MKVALITLSDQGYRVVNMLAVALPKAQVYLHGKIGLDALDAPDAFDTLHASGTVRVTGIVELVQEIFNQYQGLVFVAPCGLVLRAIAQNIRDKKTDPAVVVVDAGARFAVSLLGGHEAGANHLALMVSNILGAEPIITTTTEAVKSIIVGIGCRRGTDAGTIIKAVKMALEQAGVDIDQVRFLASVDIKADENGLLQASEELGLPLRFIKADEIKSSTRMFEASDFVQQKVNLPAVAEPAALLAGRRTKLILPKTVFGQVTVAVARESFM